MTGPGRNVRELIKSIGESLSYVLLFGPDFPADHHNSLVEEFEKVRAEAGTLGEALRGEGRKTELRLALVEIDDAQRKFAEGDSRGAKQLIQTVQGRLRGISRGAKVTITFVAGPDGVIDRVSGSDKDPQN